MKYLLIPTYYGLDAWSSEGKIHLSADTTQKQLEHLHSIGYEGVIKVENPKK